MQAIINFLNYLSRFFLGRNTAGTVATNPATAAATLNLSATRFPSAAELARVT
jgi:hypothetical protein